MNDIKTKVPVTSNNEFSSFTSINPRYTMFFSMLGRVDYNHLKICPCQKKLSDRIISEELEKEKQLIIDEDIKDRSAVENRLHRARVHALERVAAYCFVNNIRCSIEAWIVNDMLEKFDSNTGGQYDLSLSNNYLIMRALLSELLSAHRMQLISDADGIVQSWVDDHGNQRYELNPVEAARMRIDKQIVEMVEKMNNINYGAKQLNLNVEVNKDNNVTFKDLMTAIKSKRVRTEPVIEDVTHIEPTIVVSDVNQSKSDDI